MSKILTIVITGFMNAHVTAILEKMQTSDYVKLNSDFAFKLTNESERGALLIGAGKVEEYLEKLIVGLLPSKEKNYTSKLLNYPGPLSSFSGKIELPYAFRIFDERLYKSLTELRKLRNQAAHSSNSFSFDEIKENLEMIYDFEENFKEVIHKLSFDNLMKWKKIILKQAFENSKLKNYDYEKLWHQHVPNPESNSSIQKQLVVWKLAYGLTFICLKIEAIIDDYKFVIEKNKTWADYINSNA
ncbi:MAG: hypothetical protein V5804_10435 [Mucilaginibacter sp.]|uniref:hypothetical protein n=1 Tax=Mucilaginibacter sp. TaxID=1882438 RepID=UPI0034E5D4F7